MSHEVFTQAWAEAWAEQLRQSDTYRQAAATWEGTIVLEMTADEEQGIDRERAVFVDLWHGECRGARIAEPEDRETAKVVLRGAPKIWLQVLNGELEPLMGLMSGKLKVTQGKLTDLMPYVEASRELVAAAARIGTHFPAARPS